MKSPTIRVPALAPRAALDSAHTHTHLGLGPDSGPALFHLQARTTHADPALELVLAESNSDQPYTPAPVHGPAGTGLDPKSESDPDSALETAQTRCTFVVREREVM